MEKIKMYQVEPEWQESPLMIDRECGVVGDTYPDVIFVNMETGTYAETVYNKIISCFLEWEYDIEHGCTATEILNDEFPLENGKKWSTQKVSKFKKLLEKDGTKDFYEGKVFTDLLSLIIGGTWKYRTIRGYCQSDWENIIYNSDTLSDEDIHRIECEYFNMGLEFSIDNTRGYYIINDYSFESIKKELSEMIGCNTDDIELYMFDGYTKIPKYKQV